MRTFCVAVIFVIALGLVWPVIAEIPKMLNYQAVLLNDQGNPVRNQEVSLEFNIYSDPDVGDALWTETQITTTGNNGDISIILGSVDTIPDTVFNARDRWLGISVNGDAELSPRTRLVSAAYAYQAAMADTAKYALAGAECAWVDDGTVVRLTTETDSVGIGTSNPSEQLEVNGNIRVGGKANIGYGCVNTGDNAFVAGQNNIASGGHSTVSGGGQNTADAGLSTVGGGSGNDASGEYSVVSGGFMNGAIGIGSSVGGGFADTAGASGSTVAGGSNNKAFGHMATIGGGTSNIAEGEYSIIPGGYGNSAAGNRSFAAGRRAKANHDGAFVWADAEDADFASTGANQFLIRAAGGVGIGTDSPDEQLTVDGNVHVTGDLTVDGATNPMNLSTYDSGWFPVVNGGTYIKTHNLGTTKLIVQVFGAEDASGSGMALQCIGNQSHPEAGMAIQSITATQFTVQCAQDHARTLYGSEGQDNRTNDGYARIIALALE
jgi:hypothetical protein